MNFGGALQTNANEVHIDAAQSKLRLIHHTHPATAQRLDDSVVRDGLADHSAEILGLEVGSVNEGDEVGGVSERLLTLYRHSAQ